MAAALIGFIGVLAGSLISAWFNRRSERDKRRDEAALAAQLISEEMDAAARRLGAYATAEVWGEEMISTADWIKHGAALTAEMKEDAKELRRAFSLIEAWEVKRARNANQKITEKDIGKLKIDRVLLGSLATSVSEAVPAPLSSRLSVLALNAAIVAMCATAVVLIVAAFMPRAEMTDASIAAALGNQLPGEQAVACSHNTDRWHCEVVYPQRSCPVSRTLRRQTALLVSGGAQGSKHAPCGAGPGPRGPPKEYEIAEGPDGPMAMESPDEITQNEDRAVLLKVADPSEIDRAVEELFGSG